ncbi:MAG: hypothetical protein WCD18_04975 [Thermosynechococcaceae cyanobacterium]
MATQNKRVLQQVGLVLSGLSGLTLLFGTPLMAQASGGGGPRVIAAGACSGSSDWKLKAKLDNSRLEIEFEVDSNVNGQTWSNVIRDNGTLVFKGNKVTKAPSGSYTIRKFTANQAGDDVIIARAKNLKTGEVCLGSVTF